MDAKSSLPPEVWERTPVEAQAYIRALEARVTALEAAMQRLEAAVQHLTERLQQDSRPSSRPPSSDPPQALGKRLHRPPVDVARAHSPATRGRRGHCCRWMRWIE